MVLNKLNNISKAESLDEMEFMIAELLDADKCQDVRALVAKVAKSKALYEGWDDNYSIPNVNGLGRPLTKYEIEGIMLEDRRSDLKWKRPL
jgi:hypothetical protein